MQLLSLLKELSLHPKNAEELKGLILQLAVQGKLTANWRKMNPATETAAKLLKKIETEKQQLITDKKIKKEKPLPPIGDDEIPYQLPEGWEFIRLGKLVSLKSGSTINKTLELTEGDYLYVKVGGMNLPGNEKVITTSELYVNSDPKIDKALIPENSIIFPKRGGAIATNKKRIVDQPILVDLNTMAMTCPSSFTFDYLRHWFDSIDLWQLNNGTSVPQINNKDINPLVISIPPFEEQKAIVKVVNQLFAEVEQLEELTKERILLKEDFVTSALQRLTHADNTTQEWNFLQQHFSSFFTEKANIKKLRETILQLAVQGKLTAQWRSANPSVENASELLKRIEAEKQQLIEEKKIKKEKPLPAVEGEDKPYELPDGWVWSKYNDIKSPGSTISYGVLVPGPHVQDGIPLIRVGDLKGAPYGIMPAKYVAKEIEAKFSKTRIIGGEILIVVVGGIGKVCIAPKEWAGANVARAVSRTLINSMLNTNYISMVIESKYMQDYFVESTRTVAQPTLNIGMIVKALVPIPPIEEQQIIVEKVSSLMALCDELEQQIETGNTQVEQLMQSCLKEVFETS